MSNNNNEYEVGYGKPPKYTRFKPGQTGNPKGRPKNSKNTNDILKDELKEIVTLKENGKIIVMTKRQAMLRHLVNKAVQGDSKSMFFIFGQMISFDMTEAERTAVRESLSDVDKEILEEFIKENKNEN